MQGFTANLLRSNYIVCFFSLLYAFFVVRSLSLDSQTSKTSRSPMNFNWQPLDFQSFQNVLTDDGRKIAKDDKYLSAVQEMWQRTKSSDIPTEISPLIYRGEAQSSDENTQLYGNVARRKDNIPKSGRGEKRSIPGILLFHTAAGPQDVFLFYKAAIILQQIDCVVFVCDILSDEKGWGWGPDRSRYLSAKESLMNENGKLLKLRVATAIKALINIDLQSGDNNFEVDATRIGAMGWCLGGHPIFELGMTSQALASSIPGLNLRAMVTFHGVFGRNWSEYSPPQECNENNESARNSVSRGEVLIFNGALDPFVQQTDLDKVNAHLASSNFDVTVLQLEGAKHGFSNAAQSFNENPAFAYSKKAASKSWEATMMLFERKLI